MADPLLHRVNPKEVPLDQQIRHWAAVSTGGERVGQEYPSKPTGPDDQVGVGRARDGGFVSVVCDGVGTAHGSIMAKNLVGALSRTRHASPSGLIAAIETGWKQAKSITSQDVSASTVTAIGIRGNNAVWVHAGDSRLYLLRKERLTQKTRDHNKNAERALELMRKDHALSQDAAERQASREGYKKDHLTRNVATDRDLPQFETGRIELRAGDVLLLCSDGIEKYLKGDMLVDALTQALSSTHKDPADALVRMARYQAKRRQPTLQRIDDIAAAVLRVG